MTDFSHGSGGRQEPGGDGHAAGTGPWNSEQGLQGGAPYNQFGQQQAPFGQQQAPFGQQQPLGYDGAFASNNMPGAPNSMPGAPNNVPGAPNAPSQASAPDAAGRQASGEYDYARSRSRRPEALRSAIRTRRTAWATAGRGALDTRREECTEAPSSSRGGESPP